MSPTVTPLPCPMSLTPFCCAFLFDETISNVKLAVVNDC